MEDENKYMKTSVISAVLGHYILREVSIAASTSGLLSMTAEELKILAERPAEARRTWSAQTYRTMREVYSLLQKAEAGGVEAIDTVEKIVANQILKGME